MTRLVAQTVAFVVLLALWTWRLVTPVPPDLRAGLNATGEPFLIAKATHLLGYALLAGLALTLPVSRRWRRALVGLLALHGVGTEVAQTFVPGRTGLATDVLIDWCGLALGALAVRAWARRG